MQIRELEITGFMGLDAKIKLTQTVNVFFGKNDVGKSAMVDAIIWCNTGKLPHRELTTMKAAKVAVASGELQVDVFTSEGHMGRSATSNHGSLGPHFENEDLCQVLFRPMSVLDMKAQDRQKLFSSLFSGNQEAAISKYLDSQILSEDAKKRLLSDLDSADEWAREQRLVRGRELKALPEILETPSTVLIDGKTADLTKISKADVADKIMNRQIEVVKAQALIDNPPEDIAEIDAEIATKEQVRESNIDAGQSIKVDEARARVGKVTSAYNAKEAALNELLSELRMRLDWIKTMENSQSPQCPCCSQAVSDINFCVQTLRATIDGTLNRDILKRQKAADTASLEVSQAKKKLDEVKEAQAQSARFVAICDHDIESLNQRKVQAQQSGLSKEELESQLAAVQKSMENLESLLAAVTDYAAGQFDREQYLTKKAALEADIEAMNGIIRLLTPDGELRVLANQGLSEIKFDAQLSDAWGMASLTITPEGGIELFSRPIAMASASTKWRAGVLVADLLARTIGAGLLVLDGIDVLCDTRGALRDRLARWATDGTYETIIANCATEALPGPPAAAGITYWKVENGTIEEITE